MKILQLGRSVHIRAGYKYEILFNQIPSSFKTFSGKMKLASGSFLDPDFLKKSIAALNATTKAFNKGFWCRGHFTVLHKC